MEIKIEKWINCLHDYDFGDLYRDLQDVRNDPTLQFRLLQDLPTVEKIHPNFILKEVIVFFHCPAVPDNSDVLKAFLEMIGHEE